jgi:hypothetical protein
MPSVVAVCDVRTLNVMGGEYPKYRNGEDHAAGALWVAEDTSMEDTTFMIKFYAADAKLKVLRIFAHASPGNVLLGANPLDWITVEEFGRQLRGLFAPKGRIELHCCNAAADLPLIWQRLANTARAEVWASPDKQKGSTIGFDGNLQKFHPK